MGKQSREKRERREGGDLAVKENFRSKSNLEKNCLRIIRWGIYASLFTPLVINLHFFFPFVAPKTIFFRIVVEIIFAAYLFLLAADFKKYRPRINVLTLALVLFLAVFVLSSLLGVNIGRSFWSTFERMTGIWTQLHLFAFFLILSSVFKKREDWEKILGGSIVVGVILSIYILLSDEASSRGGGTIGNTSFMAAYLLFDVFFALILFLAKRGRWQIFAGLSLAVMLPVLFTSSARGAIVSFLVSLFLLLLGAFLFSGKKKLKMTAWTAIIILVLSGSVLAVLQPSFAKDRVDGTLAAMESRFVVWEKGWEGFKEKPVLGWGPENFIVVFSKNFNPCMFLPECGGEIWFDRTHNIVLDTLVATGLIGLISYLAVFLAAVYSLFRVLSKITDRKNIFIPLGLMALLFAYFFQNLLVFDMINTYLVFFLTLAFINFLTKEQAETGSAETKKVNPILGALIVLLTVFALWQGNIKPAQSGYYTVSMMGANNIAEFQIGFKAALSSWMEKYEIREYYAQKITKAVYQSEVPEEYRADFQAALDLGESEMEKSLIDNALDFRPHLFAGQLYLAAYRFSGNAEDLARADQILNKAIALSPTNEQGYWYLAEVRLAQSRTEEAISLLKTASDLDPRVGVSHWYLVVTYKLIGQYELALDELAKAELVGYNWKEDQSKIETVIAIYQALGQDPSAVNNDQNLIELYLKTLENNPEDYRAWAGLAASYANGGQYDKAREAAQKVVEISPDLAPQIETFLSELPQ